MKEQIFLNAPIQNGDFAFDSSPHKLVGVRLAEGLNSLAGNPVAPHLWNTVRLAGDNEYTAYSSAGGELQRMDYEQQKIDDRYAHATSIRRPVTEQSGITDADAEVATLAYGIIERGLAANALLIRKETVRMCTNCGNHVGASSACGGCSSVKIEEGQADKLMALRDESNPLIQPSDTYASIKTKYIADTGGHAPNPLSISVTRQLGISLEPFGLDDQVLDPRAGLHVTALAAAKRLGAKEAIMLTTASVAIKFLAYGQHFRSNEDASLRYGLYGRIPYREIATDPPVMGSLALEGTFQNWFLPLQAFITREPITTEQVRALRKFFGKLSAGTSSEDAAVAVKHQIDAEQLRWITDKRLLAGILPAN